MLEASGLWGAPPVGAVAPSEVVEVLTVEVSALRTGAPTVEGSPLLAKDVVDVRMVAVDALSPVAGAAVLVQPAVAATPVPSALLVVLASVQQAPHPHLLLKTIRTCRCACVPCVSSFFSVLFGPVLRSLTSCFGAGKPR